MKHDIPPSYGLKRKKKESTKSISDSKVKPWNTDPKIGRRWHWIRDPHKNEIKTMETFPNPAA